MHYVIELMKSQRQFLIEEIKNGMNDKVKCKVEIETAISWLSKIVELELTHPKSYEFLRLPDPGVAFAEYRVMIDGDGCSDREDWIEFIDDNGKPVTLIMYDYLIRSK